MKAQKKQIYLALTEQLLAASDREQLEAILQDNRELIDTGLIKFIELVADYLEQQQSGSSEKLGSLVQYLTKYIATTQPTQADYDFLLEVLKVIKNGGEQKQVYALLSQNLDKITLRLANALQIWSKNLLETLKAEQKLTTAYLIGDFSFSLQNFSIENSADIIEIAITGYQIILSIFTKANFSEEWAITQNHLGIAYRQRIRGDKANNLEQAIAYFEQALTIYTQQEFPVDWASTHNNLAIVYKERIKGNKADNLEQAISLYEQALTIYTQQEFPVDWASTHNNLAIVYKERIKGNKADNLEQAISLYEQALTIYTQQEFPVDWANIQNNLGNVYRQRIRGDKADNLEQAIACFEQALIICTQQEFPRDWASTQNNLAIVYSNRIRGDKADNLEQAIACFEQALIIRTQQKFPHEWATTQNNLGLTYNYRIRGERADNIEKAIECYENALSIRTQQKFPYEWAMTQNNLGLAYHFRIRGERAGNLQRAIFCLEQALIIRTSKANPIECLQTARNLGNLYFAENNWQKAIEAYTTAIEAVEQSREWATTDHNKQEIISNAISVYQNIVEACINLGQLDKALEYVERGKARNLVELLATRDLYPKGNIPQQILTRLDELRKEVVAEERRLRQQNNSLNGFNSSTSTETNRDLAATQAFQKAALDRTHLNYLRQQLEQLITEHIQSIDPSFQLTQRVEPIKFKQIQATLPNQQTALIEWFIGNGTVSAFIVTSTQSTPVCIDYNKEQFNYLLKIFEQYLNSYSKRDNQWQNNLSNLLAQLAQYLQLETIIEQIKQILPHCQQIILVPHRWLHLLPLHALPLANGKCLLDLFNGGVSYAPSVQLLQLTQTQTSKNQPNQRFFGVQNPTEDLSYTNIEVQTIKKQFSPRDDVLEGQQAQKQALTKQRLIQANFTHFSCHGYFNFEQPELSALLLADSQVEKEVEKETVVTRKTTRFLPERDGQSIDLKKLEWQN